MATLGRIFRLICIAAGVTVLGVAVCFRCWDLGRIPGVNGDEAWYGVQAERLVGGKCFSGRTPTGNVINPFFMAPQVALHAFFEPSFTLLRVPALASGLLAIVLNFCLCRRAFGWRMAWLTTLIHAMLPINIAYSRFAWDASQSLLATLPVVYAGVLANREPQRRGRWTTIGLSGVAAAVIVHPTNLLIAPFFAVLCAAGWRDRLLGVWRLTGVRRLVVPLLIVGGTAAFWPMLPRVAANVSSIDNYTAFAKRYGDLFTGATVYEYISGASIPSHDGRGSIPTQIALEWMEIAVAGAVAFALWNSIRRGKSTIDAYALAGWAACVACFFAIAGPGAIAPHFERYAICLVAPTVLVVARGLHWWMQPTTRFSLLTGPVLLVLGGWMLTTFNAQYFEEFQRHGGRSHLTFRTAAVEPKQQAIQLVVSTREPGTPTLIQTSEWWLYWPLRYLAYRYDDLSVELRSSDDPRPLDQQAFDDMETWIVEFAEEDAGWNIEKAYAALRPDQAPFAEKTIIQDAAGRDLLLLIRLPAKR